MIKLLQKKSKVLEMKYNATTFEKRLLIPSKNFIPVSLFTNVFFSLLIIMYLQREDSDNEKKKL